MLILPRLNPVVHKDGKIHQFHLIFGLWDLTVLVGLRAEFFSENGEEEDVEEAASWLLTLVGFLVGKSYTKAS